MSKFKIKYKEVDMNGIYIPKETIVEADDVQSAKARFFEHNKGYDGIRRPRIFISEIKEVVEEDGATQASSISGPVSVFGKNSNKVDNIYMDLLNLEDYE